MADPQNSFVLRDVSDRDVLLLAHRMAEAYFDDPVQAWLFPNRGHRLRDLRRSFEHELRASLLERAVGQTTVEGAGCAFWLPPGAWAGPRSRHDGAGLRRRLGSRAFRTRRLARRTRAAHPTVDHWYLAHLAVAPAYQHRGVPELLLAEGIARAKADVLPIYIECSSATSVPLFKRFGFLPLEAIDLPGGPPVFPMMRPPVSEPVVSGVDEARQ